jgi:hypothetical protein
MAVPTRLELVTFGLGNRCSIRLSYGTRDASFIVKGGILKVPVMLRTPTESLILTNCDENVPSGIASGSAGCCQVQNNRSRAIMGSSPKRRARAHRNHIGLRVDL